MRSFFFCLISTYARGVALVALYVAVDNVDKLARGQEGDGAAEDANRHAQHRRVREVEGEHEEARHARLVNVVIRSVREHVERRRGATGEGGPRPSVVFGAEQPIRRGDRHAGGDNDEDQQHEQHEAVDVVHLVVPEGGEDKVELNEDADEGQHAAREDNQAAAGVPPAGGDHSRDLIDARHVEAGAAGAVAAEAAVAADDGANNDERKRDAEPQEEQHDHAARVHNLRRVVPNRDKVQQKAHPEDRAGVQQRGGQHALNPLGGDGGADEGVLRELRGGEEAGSVGGAGEGEQRVGREGALVGVHYSHDGDEADYEHKDANLAARPDERAEQHRPRGDAEDVVLQLLPPPILDPILLAHLLGRAVLVKARIVCLQRAVKNNKDDADEEKDEHKRVEDGEPMRLVLEECVVEVAVKAAFEAHLWPFDKRDAIREGNWLLGAEGHRRVRGEVDGDDAVAIVAKREVLVSVDGVPLRRTDLSGLSEGRPHRQVVGDELVPILLGDHRAPLFVVLLLVRNGADGGALDALLELGGDVHRVQLVAGERLPQRGELRVARGWRAARHLKEGVGLEGVVEGANLVRVDDDGLAVGIRVGVLVGARRPCGAEERGCSNGRNN